MSRTEIENELLIALEELTENAEQAAQFIPHILLERAITRAKFAIIGNTYPELKTTTIKTQADMSTSGKRGHEAVEASLYWGSSGDSKLAVRICLHWPKGNDKPTLTIELPRARSTNSIIVKTSKSL